MSTFDKQLEALRTNMGKLNALVLACPELFEHAHGVGVQPDRVWVYLHATSAPNEDCRAFALRYKAAGWQRERSAAYPGGYDWAGKLNGVELCIIGAELRSEPVAVFEEPTSAATVEEAITASA